jgi:hypothetical protein
MLITLYSALHYNIMHLKLERTSCSLLNSERKRKIDIFLGFIAEINFHFSRIQRLGNFQVKWK